MNIRRKILFLVLAVVVVGVFVTIGYSKKNEAGSTQTVLTIGAISGITGEYAAVGVNWAQGVRLAHEEYSKDNPELDIRLFEEDSEFNTAIGVSAYQKLKSIHDIDALINLDTFTINGIYDLVTAEQFPVMQGGEQSIEPANDNVFQIMPGNIFLEIELGKHVNAVGFDKVVVFHTDENTYIRFADAFAEGYGEPLTKVALPASEKSDFRTHVTKALAQNPDAIVIIGIPDQGAGLIQEIRKQTQEMPPLIFDANFQSGKSDYERILGDISFLDGSIVATIEQTVSDDFVEKYTERYGIEPGIFSDLGYDAFMLLMESYDADGERWIENVRNSKYVGVGGTIELDNVGVRKPQFEIKTLVNGELQ